MIRVRHATCDGRIELAQHRVYFGTVAALFAASVAATIHFGQSMSGGMVMPGDWTMSMTWMKMGGQSWPSAAASFIGMWVVMMAAMMLPALVPTLLRYRLSLSGIATIHLNALTAITGIGYFAVWTLLGAVVYPLGLLIAKAEMTSPVLARSSPISTGSVVLLAGGLQLTSWKRRQLCHCRAIPGCGQASEPDAGNAWRQGIHMGTDCALCCSGLMMILLVTGVMDLHVMAVLTVAITTERLSPRPEPAARAAGAVIVATSFIMIGRAVVALVGT